MRTTRHVRLFRNGANQAIRIPKDLELPGTSATIRKVGNTLVIEPEKKPNLLEVLKTLKPLKEGLPEIADEPPEPVNL